MFLEFCQNCQKILGVLACSWSLGRGEETLLSSGWTLIGSELSSPNFNSSVRAEWLFAIRYLTVVIKPLCGNIVICLNYYCRPRNSVHVLSVANRYRKWKMLFGTRFSVTLSHNLADFATSGAKSLSTQMHLLSRYLVAMLIAWTCN